jgi:hypothetical protein
MNATSIFITMAALAIAVSIYGILAAREASRILNDQKKSIQ